MTSLEIVTAHVIYIALKWCVRYDCSGGAARNRAEATYYVNCMPRKQAGFHTTFSLWPVPLLISQLCFCYLVGCCSRVNCITMAPVIPELGYMCLVRIRSTAFVCLALLHTNGAL